MSLSKKKTVFITGVSSGLGKALAKHYLAAGCRVYGISRRSPEDLLGFLDFHFFPVDLADLRALPVALASLLSVPSINLVVLNAGILGVFGDMTEVSLDIMREVMDTNLWANKVVLDFFIQQKTVIGQVVAISSGASLSGARGWNAYGMSKAALNMLIKLYAKEMETTHLCALAPGLVDSPMQDYLCGLNLGNEYSTLERIQEQRYTETMPGPEIAAGKIARCIDKVKEGVGSGDYVDIREFDASS